MGQVTSNNVLQATRKKPRVPEHRRYPPLVMQALRRVLIATILVAAAQLAQAQDTFDVAVRGVSCRQNQQGVLNCTYRVGKDLEFGIASVGSPDAGISFLRSDITGDYYARFGTLHGCVIIALGSASRETKRSGFAFVSPRNGKVYREWEECRAAK